MDKGWATVVIYSNSSTASADLSQFTKDPDWKTAQVVTLESWCQNATGIEIQRPSSDGGSVFALHSTNQSDHVPASCFGL
jgi:hypothetical protein